MIERADVTLPSEREVAVVRSFRAPRATVYRAFTEPGLVKQWMLGPPGWTMPVCEMDVRVGGRYRWVWRSEAGDGQFGFNGEYLEVEPDVRIVHTEYFDQGSIDGEYPGAGARVTTRFADDGEATTVTTVMDFGSREARDAAMATGMTDGMEQSYALLDRQLASQPARPDAVTR